MPVTVAENAVNSSIFVLDDEDGRTMQSKFTARLILSFAGWGGVGGVITFVARACERSEHPPCPRHHTVRVTSACERPQHLCPHHDNVCFTSACEWPEHPCPHHWTQHICCYIRRKCCKFQHFRSMKRTGAPYSANLLRDASYLLRGGVGGGGGEGVIAFQVGELCVLPVHANRV